MPAQLRACSIHPHFVLINFVLSLQAHISCDSEPLSVGSHGFIITRTNFVTLRYHTDSWGSANNGFNLVITAFKNSQTFGCADSFACDAHICISKDLVSVTPCHVIIKSCHDNLQVCDGASHCGHGEDEASPGVCSGSSLSALLGLDLTTVMASVSLGLLLAGAAASGVCIWSLRRRRLQATEAATTLLNNESFTSEYI